MSETSGSGPVDRDVGPEVEECDWIVAQVLVELGAAQGRTALEIDPSITGNFALRRAVVRAAWEAATAKQAAELDRLRAEADFYRRRCDALQAWQSKMRDPERTIVCDILANGSTLPPAAAGDRYSVRLNAGSERETPAAKEQR